MHRCAKTRAKQTVQCSSVGSGCHQASNDKEWLLLCVVAEIQWEWLRALNSVADFLLELRTRNFKVYRTSPGQMPCLQVADFGLSRGGFDIHSKIETQTLGTVTHMPPELLISGLLSKPSDVYAFGILLWEL